MIEKETYVDPLVRISPRNFDRLSQFITKELGIKMPESKVSMLQSRLMRRVRHLGLQSIDDYCEYLLSSPDSHLERSHLINAITTNKTDFFREPQHFKYLTEVVLPEFERSGRLHPPNERLAVWSAACSSGQEPYTIAMVLSQYALSRPRFDFQILATDVSTNVLQIAKDGIYHKDLVAPVPREIRAKYLLQGKGEQRELVRVVPALRRKISFHQLNFMDATYGVRHMFDVVFCRNVLIYFERPVQETVIRKLCQNLNPGGYLFISHSESLTSFKLPLIPVGPASFRKV